METRTKAIIASAVVLALLLAGVSGVTYSWFSDTENAGVDVMSGKVSVETSVSSLVDASEDGSTFTEATADEMKNGYNFGFNDEAVATVEDGQVKVENMVANDALTMEVSGTIDYSVSIAYRVSAVVEAVAPATEDDFIVEFYSVQDEKETPIEQKQMDQWTIAHPEQANTTESIDLGDFKIKLKMDPGSNAQSASATIGMKIEVYQQNAVLPDGSVKVSATADEWVFQSLAQGSEEVVSASVGFTASAGDYVIAAYDNNGKDSFTYSGNTYAILGGISVDWPSDTTVSKLSTLRFVVDASLVDSSSGTAFISDMAVYALDSDTFAEKLDNGTFVKNSDGSYTVTYSNVTKHQAYVISPGSNYDVKYVSGNEVKFIGLASIFDSPTSYVTDASTVIELLTDVAYPEWNLGGTIEDSPLKIMGTLDGNGHTLSLNSSYFKNGSITYMIDPTGDLTIKDLTYDGGFSSTQIHLVNPETTCEVTKENVTEKNVPES